MIYHMVDVSSMSRCLFYVPCNCPIGWQSVPFPGKDSMLMIYSVCVSIPNIHLHKTLKAETAFTIGSEESCALGIYYYLAF